VPHAATVLASPCAGSDGWAILAEPPGDRDLVDPRYWETSLERSLRRRATRPVRRGGPPAVRIAATLALSSLAAPAVAGASSLDLSVGSSGYAVRQLQAKLGIPVDGEFGPQTDAAVRSFQRDHELPVTGLVGPLTRAALGEDGAAPTNQSGDATASAALSSSQIEAAQRQLGVTADGVIGPQTRAAIRTFQSSHGLPVDGQLGAQTLSALGGGAESTSGVPAQATSGKAAAAVQAALSKVGAPYRSAGTGPSGFDCSGLVMWAFAQAGVSMPHSSYAQYGLGRSVSSDQIQAGDLVFFDTAGSGASDVGIATSATTAVSATTHGVMTHSIRSGYWGSHYVGARRVV
jgi:cell wall-associated NlpC family hydrolase